MEQVLKKEKQIQAKPIMKWAGGKTQMLGDIMLKIPQKYGKYIEPFVGGGALFFALSPDKAIIADSNPELINMYRQIADNVEAAHKAGITAIIQPGGSIRDKDCIDKCNEYGIAMVFTGMRHFKH